MPNIKMSTDSKFIAFIKEHLDTQLYNRIMKNNHYCSFNTFLIVMSGEKLSENILDLIEQFLVDLPFEEASAYVNKINVFGNALIFCCVNVGLLERIIKYIPNINAITPHGHTALMCACARTGCSASLDLDIIKFFLDRGVNINATNKRNESALMCLCKDRYNENLEQAIELLIFNGADPHIVSKDGYVAYDYVGDKSALSERSQQLLRGAIKMNNTKRAVN